MRQVPEPERQEWIARMRERARLDAEELVPHPAFDVFGLMAPPLRPMALVNATQMDDVWESVALAYGDWDAPVGPWVVVFSSIRVTGPPEAELIRAIDFEWNRLADAAGVDEAEPAGPPAYSRADLVVGDRTVSALVCRDGNVLAAHVPAGQVIVTVVSRGVDLDLIRLGVVTSLEPYLEGQRELLAQVAERDRQQPEPVLEPAEGMAAYRALVDVQLESHARFLAANRAGRVIRFRAGEGATLGALWQRAASELADRAGIDMREATENLSLAVNQLMTLAEKAPWFTGDARLRERAIDETLRHAVLDEPVPSSEAQRRWAGFWGYQTSVAVQAASEPVQSGARLGGELLKSRWLDAWAEWTLGR
jgi:hypothetical protein